MKTLLTALLAAALLVPVPAHAAEGDTYDLWATVTEKRASCRDGVETRIVQRHYRGTVRETGLFEYQVPTTISTFRGEWEFDRQLNRRESKRLQCDEIDRLRDRIRELKAQLR